MGDDTRQDEDHAEDGQKVGGVLRAEPVMPGVCAACQVEGHVENTRGDDQQQPDLTQGREGGCLVNESSATFYRQHVLVIHPRPETVKVYRE